MLFSHYKAIEKKLRKAAGLMPEPTKPLFLSSIMEERKQTDRKHFLHSLRIYVWHTPAWRMAVIVLLVFAVGSTTIFAASSKLRTVITHVFSSGITETIPIWDLETEEPVSYEDCSEPANDSSSELSGNITRQTAGSLTLIQDVTLDAHFTASYASSLDYLTLEETPSGIPLFRTQAADGKTAYYSVTDGDLEEIVLKPQTLKAAVQPGMLPGIMTYSGSTEGYRNLTLPLMEFHVVWRQYGTDILLDDTESGYRFDIGSAGGVDLGDDYDGQFFYQTLEGNEDMIQVFFLLDAQQTGYQYPFLLNLKTGEVSDPLALADLSDWDCITELSIQPDLATATAMAGSSHEDMQKITIDLKSGKVIVDDAYAGKPPADDSAIWFSVGNHTLFYLIGTEECGDGYLYDTQTGESTVLFTDAAYSRWDGAVSTDRYWESIGYGYLAYYADNCVSLINLQDGGRRTVLDGIPMSRNVEFFMNDKATVLSVSTRSTDSFDMSRLCLMDLKTMDAWYFERELPEGVEEYTNYWSGEYGYVIEARNTETGKNYIYLYQYAPFRPVLTHETMGDEKL